MKEQKTNSVIIDMTNKIEATIKNNMSENAPLDGIQWAQNEQHEHVWKYCIFSKISKMGTDRL